LWFSFIYVFFIPNQVESNDFCIVANFFSCKLGLILCLGGAFGVQSHLLIRTLISYSELLLVDESFEGSKCLLTLPLGHID